MKIAVMLGIVMMMPLMACGENNVAETSAQNNLTEQSVQADSSIENANQSESSDTMVTEEVSIQETTTQTEVQSVQEVVTVDRITIQVGEKTFTATLNSSAAAQEFAARLPLTLSMSELHGNEKYYYLDKSLPTASEAVGNIRSGDLMLYGSDCLVLFYEDFSTPYSYTRLGKIDDPTGLAEALGRGGIEISFVQEV